MLLFIEAELQNSDRRKVTNYIVAKIREFFDHSSWSDINELRLPYTIEKSGVGEVRCPPHVKKLWGDLRGPVKGNAKDEVTENLQASPINEKSGDTYGNLMPCDSNQNSELYASPYTSNDGGCTLDTYAPTYDTYAPAIITNTNSYMKNFHVPLAMRAESFFTNFNSGNFHSDKRMAIKMFLDEKYQDYFEKTKLQDINKKKYWWTDDNSKSPVTKNVTEVDAE
ncbi:hypothetical protein BDK51DRAFT_40910 [Blyttiomyces helicus]|uniref:Uncharacterized protein n=1 Tax=Blyttiomyces helicus TaxID=388810 RepID=A0A4P9VUE1_9FUNG|nr:hypothetical protein BDK51DRAFT_40910 [Blyttiomyces helicus]|eukprot:RKO83204.1 hypothetical protein BDK51DRAFT_40910 [Blyttiomyces helicus]